MTSQSWSCREYLIPTYSTPVLHLDTFWAKNLDYLTSFNKILFIKTSTVFLNWCDFWNMFSQGSATTCLRYCKICNDHFVANYLLSLAMKEFWKSINILRSYRHQYSVLCFDSQCILQQEVVHNFQICITKECVLLSVSVTCQDASDRPLVLASLDTALDSACHNAQASPRLWGPSNRNPKGKIMINHWVCRRRQYLSRASNRPN